MRKTLLWGLCLLLTFARPAAAETPAKLKAALDAMRWPGAIHSAIGVTRQETAIPCVITTDDLDYNTPKFRVLLVGGLRGDDGSLANVVEMLRWFHTSEAAKPQRERHALSAVPCVNPDGLAAGKQDTNGSGGNPAIGYPPTGEAYGSKTDPEAAYLWHWIGMHAPDAVIVVNSADFPYAHRDDRGTLVHRAKNAPFITGEILVGSVQTVEELQFVFDTWPRFRSQARRELQQRLNRTPVQIAQQLASVYGQRMKQVNYIDALAMIGRLRLGELTSDAKQLADIERIVAPYLDGKSTLGDKPSGATFAGHLVFGALADATGNEEYIALVKTAADRGFDAQGNLLEAMPEHLEMSDAVFMGCPILAQAGRLTEEPKYFDMCVGHMRFMLALNLRADGLHRHSPLNDTAWGRGNGFPALALSLALTDLPEKHAGRQEMLDAFRRHIDALLKHQDPTGCWHQVIDRPESYRELTATCMITFALARGVRMGWFDKEKYLPAIERGWYAVQTRVAPDGSLVDVCTGTGKQKSLRDYYDRTAILGRDDRGGAMALMLATEMIVFDRWRGLAD